MFKYAIKADEHEEQLDELDDEEQLDELHDEEQLDELQQLEQDVDEKFCLRLMEAASMELEKDFRKDAMESKSLL